MNNMKKNTGDDRMDYSTMDFKKVLERINDLYNKSKNEGLTEEEKKEQTEIRRYYISVIKGNVKCNLDNIHKNEVGVGEVFSLPI